MSKRDFYAALREERRNQSRREAADQIGKIIESLDRLLFGYVSSLQGQEPDEGRVVSARRLLSIRQDLKNALRALREAEQ